MSDDLTLDLSDIDSYGGFEAVPGGWYKCTVTDYTDAEVKNDGGKLEQGTPGTNWEFTVQEGEHTGRKFWTNHWHHAKTLGFMKGFLLTLDAFPEGSLDGSFSLSDRDKALGQDVMVRVAKREYPKGSGEFTNDVKGFKPVGSVQSGPSGAAGIMP